MTARDLCRQAVIAEGRRTLTLTGRGLAALDAARRVTPADLFTDKQLRAIEAAGLSECWGGVPAYPRPKACHCQVRTS